MVNTKRSTKLVWWVATIGASVGLVASFIQTIERISYADQPLKALTCDINSVFSCSSVFDGWQSSFFGFSNSIMCLAFFAVVLGVAISGLTGSLINRYLRLIMHFFSVFFLFFGAWYLQQSAYDIGALCIFCIFCYSGVIALNWAWLRINIDDLAAPVHFKKQASKLINSGADTFLWLLWAIAIAIMIIIKYI